MEFVKYLGAKKLGEACRDSCLPKFVFLSPESACLGASYTKAAFVGDQGFNPLEK